MGTFFARSRLRLIKVKIIVANWIITEPATLAATFADAAETSAVKWNEYCLIS